MIPTLKQAHETRIKRRLIEIKSDPDLLQEFYNQRQLEQMTKALKKLAEVFRKPEFKGLPSFQLAVQKAYAALDDYLSMSKARRAVSLGSEIKEIGGFTAGIAKLVKQLPHIVEIALSKLEYEWTPDQSIKSIFGQENDPSERNLKKLHKHILKAMKPGFFGISDLPYINSYEAAREILGLSIDQIRRLEQVIAASHIMQQTLGSESFMSQITKEPSSATQPSQPVADEKISAENMPVVKTKLPQAVTGGSGPAKMTLHAFRGIFDKAFDEAMAGLSSDVEPEERHALRISMLVAMVKELQAQNIVAPSKKKG